MASINPSYLNCKPETHTSKRAYLRLTITEIRQTDGATNSTTVDWKITIEGTRYVYLYGAYVTLGGRVLYDNKGTTPIRTEWYAGDIIASGTETFTNNNDGSLTLNAYIKQLFYYGYNSSRWNDANFVQDNSGSLVCSTIPRFPQLNFTSVTTQLNRITCSISNTLNINVSDYEVRKVSDNSLVTSGSVNNSSTFTFTLTGLTPNTNYSGVYKVRGYANGGWGDYITLTSSNMKTTALPTVSSTSTSLDGTSVIQFTNLNYISSWNIVGKVKSTGTTLFTIDDGTINNYNLILSDSTKNALASKYPTSNYPVLKLEVSVVSNGISYRINDTEITYSIPDNSTYQPGFTGSNITDIKELDYTSITGNSSKFIKNHNRLQGTIKPMALKYGASGNGYSINVGTKNTSLGYSTSDQTFTLSNIDTNNLTIVASDKRNKSTSVSTPLTLIDYFNPKVYDLNLVRQNGIDNYALLSSNGEYTNWTGLLVPNTILKLEYRFKLSTDSNYGNWVEIPLENVTIDNGRWSIDKYLLEEEYSNISRFDFQLRVTDKLEQVISEPSQLSTARVFIWKDTHYSYFGIGKKPDYRLDVAGDIHSDRNVIADGKLVNPQGSVVATLNRGSGTYCYAMTLQGNMTSPTQYICFDVVQLDRIGRVKILLGSTGEIGVFVVSSIQTEGNIQAYYELTTNEHNKTIFNLYIQRSSTDDSISIHNLQFGDYLSDYMKLQWVGTSSNSLPSGYTTVNKLLSVPTNEFVDGDLEVSGVLNANNIKENNIPIFKSINWSDEYDFNMLTQSGVYYAGTNCANAPAVYCKVLVMGRDTNTNYGDVTQLAISIATPNIYIRTRNNTNWSSWKLMVQRETIFPVGSIYMSVTNTNPSNSFGGTWVLWGQGRVPVGVDTSQSEFSSVEKTGGAKISTQINTGGSAYGFTTSSPSGYNDRTLVGSSSYGNSHDEKSADISLLQPYITCYMWKRTA